MPRHKPYQKPTRPCQMESCRSTISINGKRKYCGAHTQEECDRDSNKKYETKRRAKVKAFQEGSIIIGEFQIARLPGSKFWISIYGDGEGGEFSEKSLSDAIKKFYAENF